MKKGILVLTDAINLDGALKRILVVPRGKVESRKGEFLVDELSFKEIYSYYKQRKLDLVIDYEHQTLDNVQAPAAGWIKELYLTEKGIEADVDWTEKGQEYLKNKEYRYLSPVIYRRASDGRAIILHSVALTNTPAIDGMEAIINSLDINNIENGGNTMDLKELAVLLGLQEDATLEQIQEAVKALVEMANKEKEDEKKEDVVACKEILETLGLSAGASVTDVKGKIISLKNPAGYVRVEEFTALKEKIQKKESNELVEMALKDGKITPAQKDWAEKMALKDPEGFKSFVEVSPKVVNFDETKYKEDQKKSSEGDWSINKQLGISDDDIKKYGGAE